MIERNITKIIISLIFIALICSCRHNDRVQYGDDNRPQNNEQYHSSAEEGTSFSQNLYSDDNTQRDLTPSVNSIKYDLVGRMVNEGTTEGYHDSDWRYLIEDGDVEGVEIEEVLANDDRQYTAVIRLKLRGVSSNSDSNRSNYYYDTKVKVRYVNDTRKGWELDYVNSLGMKVVSDHAYDDLISMANDNVRTITNHGDIPLTVGGRYLKNDSWSKFLILVPVHGQSAPLYDGIIMATFVDDAVIDFIIR